MLLVLGALLIFFLRICDVSIGTLRVIYAVQGQRLKACLLGFGESGIFVLAIAQVFRHLDNPLNMIGYAAGFATGTFIGITLEKWIASGWIMVRIISRDQSGPLLQMLRERNFGVTSIRGEGREGEILVLFVVAKRRRGYEMLDAVRQIDPQAFVTVDPVNQAIGGYIPQAAAPASVRK